MNKGPLESKLVRLVMPNATAQELADATVRWFGFLQVLEQIARDMQRPLSDSHGSTEDDRVATTSGV